MLLDIRTRSVFRREYHECEGGILERDLDEY